MVKFKDKRFDKKVLMTTIFAWDPKGNDIVCKFKLTICILFQGFCIKNLMFNIILLYLRLSFLKSLYVDAVIFHGVAIGTYFIKQPPEKKYILHKIKDAPKKLNFQIL